MIDILIALVILMLGVMLGAVATLGIYLIKDLKAKKQENELHIKELTEKNEELTAAIKELQELYEQAVNPDNKPVYSNPFEFAEAVLDGKEEFK